MKEVAGIDSTTYSDSQELLYKQAFVQATVDALGHGVTSDDILVTAASVLTPAVEAPNYLRTTQGAFALEYSASVSLAVSYTVNIPNAAALGFSSAESAYETQTASSKQQTPISTVLW